MTSPSAAGGRVGIVTGMLLIVVTLMVIDLVTLLVREHRVRSQSAILLIVLVTLAVFAYRSRR